MGVITKVYQTVFKPLAFRRDPEIVHDKVLSLGKFLGSNVVTRKLTQITFTYENPRLEQDIFGIHFKNPIGLAAGFDKNAELLGILPSVGFGFAEVGSITGQPCKGNNKPRLWRLPKSQSLVVYYGLKNEGSEVIAKRLRAKKFNFPFGVSVAKTNSEQTVKQDDGIADYKKAYLDLLGIGQYVTINISCPNAFGGQPFTDPESLDALLRAIDEVSDSRPNFIKMPVDISFEQVDKLLEVMARHKIHGLISSNLTKKRDNPAIVETEIPEHGGLSGKIVEELSNKLLAYLYKKTQGHYILIGCGGVFSAEDAYKKIRLGASLIQLITGMIYEGPQLIGEINRGLVELLKRDGFNNISEAVGVDNR